MSHKVAPQGVRLGKVYSSDLSQRDPRAVGRARGGETGRGALSRLARWLALPAFALPAACALEEQPPAQGTGGAGSGGSATGGALAGGAAGTSGGSSATGGSSGSSGTAGSSGGSAGSAAGTGGAGGTAGSSAQTGGSAGSSSAGMAGAAGGSGAGGTAGEGGTAGMAGSSGSSGTAGDGGTSAGMSGAGGMAGAGGGGAGGPTIESTLPGLDGFTQTYPCGGDFTGYDCLNTMCDNNQRTVQTDFEVGGMPADTFEVEFRVRGIVEAKNYNDQCVRRTNSHDNSVQGGDFLCSGGGPRTSSYNEYSLAVTEGAVDGQPNYFGLNARDGSSEDHESFALNFTFKLQVHGGGTIRYRMFDNNCRQITNCGQDTGGSNCGSDQRILMFAAETMPVPDVDQPYMGAQQSNGPGQWLALDVLSVVAL